MLALVGRGDRCLQELLLVGSERNGGVVDPAREPWKSPGTKDEVGAPVTLDPLIGQLGEPPFRKDVGASPVHPPGESRPRGQQRFV